MCTVLCPIYFCNRLKGEERAVFFTSFVFLVSCDCFSYVALPNGVVGVIVVFPGHTHFLTINTSLKIRRMVAFKCYSDSSPVLVTTQIHVQYCYKSIVTCVKYVGW